MKLIRCECGQALGKVAGEYEFRCHKCKRVIAGRVDLPKIRGQRLPRNMLPVR